MTNEAEQVLLAAIVAAVAQFVNKYTKFSRYAAVALAIVISFAGALAYSYILKRELWPAVLRVFAYASAIYAVIIKQVQPEEKPQ